MTDCVEKVYGAKPTLFRLQMQRVQPQIPDAAQAAQAQEDGTRVHKDIRLPLLRRAVHIGDWGTVATVVDLVTESYRSRPGRHTRTRAHWHHKVRVPHL